MISKAISKISPCPDVPLAKIPIFKRGGADALSPPWRMNKFTFAGVYADVGNTIATICGKKHQVPHAQRLFSDRCARPELGA
jgi:hypothetical protein